MIKLENLRVFVNVAETGNIKDAAERLYRTASAISMTLKQLEQDVGSALFETDRKDKLTALGKFVLETGRVQIQNYDHAIDRIRAFADNKIGHLALASVPSVAANLLPVLLPGYVAKWPGVEIELFDLDSQSVRLFVESGKADIGISGKPQITNIASYEPLFRDRFMLVCSSSNRLADKGLLDWSDIEGETLIINGASETIQSKEYQTLAEESAITVRNVTSLMALVKAGLGVTLLPALSTIDMPEGLVALDLEGDNLEREVGFLTRRNSNPSPVTSAFRTYILKELPKLAQDTGLNFVYDGL